MYGKEKYSPAARSSDIRKAFIKAARKCGFVAQQADYDMTDGDIKDMLQMSVYLEAEIHAMRARHSK
jgi:hypothetical protein